MRLLSRTEFDNDTLIQVIIITKTEQVKWP